MENQNHDRNLAQKKSLLIIQAQFQQALGQHGEAARLFLEAALLEEKLARQFRQADQNEDAVLSLFSAASCYKNAGQLAQAIALADEAIALSVSEIFTKEIRQFRNECELTLTTTRGRNLRGVVRNGAVHPFEPGVLAEGQFVTITAA